MMRGDAGRADAGLMRGGPPRETKFSGANEDRKKCILAAQLTTSRIDNLTWLINSLYFLMTIYIYIQWEDSMRVA